MPSKTSRVLDEDEKKKRNAQGAKTGDVYVDVERPRVDVTMKARVKHSMVDEANEHTKKLYGDPSRGNPAPIEDYAEQEVNRIKKTTGGDINLNQRSASDPVLKYHHEHGD